MDLKSYFLDQFLMSFFQLFNFQITLGFERELLLWLLDVVLPVALYACYLKPRFPQIFSL